LRAQLERALAQINTSKQHHESRKTAHDQEIESLKSRLNYSLLEANELRNINKTLLDERERLVQENFYLVRKIFIQRRR
jgi:hypothetical protein